MTERADLADSGHLLPAPSYTDDDYRRLHAQLVDTQEKLSIVRESFAEATAKIVEVTRERDEATADLRQAQEELAEIEDVAELATASAEAAEAKLAITTEAAGRVTEDLFEAEPNIGYPTAEPNLRQIIYKYYEPHFGPSEAESLMLKYIAALPHMPAGRWQK